MIEPRVANSPVPEYCESLGLKYDPHFNNSPIEGEIVREVSMHDFVRGHAWDGIGGKSEYRQLMPKNFKVLDETEVDYFKKVGAHAIQIQSISFFVSHGNVWGTSVQWWDGKMRFWKVGCDHVFTHKTVASFQHVASCTKCSYKVGYDSSD